MTLVSLRFLNLCKDALSVRDYIASMIGWILNIGQLVELELAEETEVLGEILPQCHSAHHKSHMT
jgi:hypothetical protein